MKYEVIMEKNGYALIKRGIDLEEYAVVSRLNRETESWAYTCVYYNFSPFSNLTQAEALALSTDYFCYKTPEKNIFYLFDMLFFVIRILTLIRISL